MGLFGKSPAKATTAAAPAAKHDGSLGCLASMGHDPYDQLPAVPSFELTSETVTHGATAWSEWLCLRSCSYVAAHRCLRRDPPSWHGSRESPIRRLGAADRAASAVPL